MSFTPQEWLGDYQKSKEFLIQLRTQAQTQKRGGGGGSSQQQANLQQSIDRLDYRLGLMEQNPAQFHLTDSEVIRRRELVKGLRKQMSELNKGGGGGGGGGGSSENVGPRTLAQQRRELISEQDDLLDDLGRGVDRLKMQGMTIRDETTLHKKLLDDIDGDVEAAASSLRLEARHAQRIREQSTVCRLYLCIAILVIILVLLLVIGFT